MQSFLSWRMQIETSSVSFSSADRGKRKCCNIIRVENGELKIVIHAHGRYRANASAPV